MKKFLRIAVAIFLVAVLLSEIVSCGVNIFGPGDEDIVSTVCEIVSVDEDLFDASQQEGYDRRECYYVNARPVGRGNNEELILYTVNCDTDMDSEFSRDRSKIPELQIGAVVEITHTYKISRYSDRLPNDERNDYLFGYEAFSIRLYEGEYRGRQTVLQRNREFSPLSIAESWITSYGGTGHDMVVTHVAKVTSPLNGYIVYGEDHYVEVYWIGAGLLMDSATKRALDSGAVGYSLKIFSESNRPFNNISAKQCVRIEMVSNFDSHKKYHEYDISEFVGEKKILVTSDKFHGQKVYYYIELESGEVVASFAENEEDGYTELSCVMANGESAKGELPIGGFAGDIYFSFENTGDVPAAGRLIVSLEPLERLEDRGALELR